MAERDDSFQLLGVPGQCPVAPKELFSLSEREDQILRMIWDGRTTAEMATELGVTPDTVREYKKRLQAKVGAERPSVIIKTVVTRLPHIYKA